jgi:hypothetical protein
LQKKLSENPQNLPNLIDTIIFLDNLFKTAYGSVTRNSSGRELAEFGSIRRERPLHGKTTKDSQADSRNSGVDSSCHTHNGRNRLGICPVHGFAFFLLHQ